MAGFGNAKELWLIECKDEGEKPWLFSTPRATKELTQAAIDGLRKDFPEDESTYRPVKFIRSE